jgi:hypothetical protein
LLGCIVLGYLLYKTSSDSRQEVHDLQNAVNNIQVGNYDQDIERLRAQIERVNSVAAKGPMSDEIAKRLDALSKDAESLKKDMQSLKAVPGRYATKEDLAKTEQALDEIRALLMGRRAPAADNPQPNEDPAAVAEQQKQEKAYYDSLTDEQRKEYDWFNNPKSVEACLLSVVFLQKEPAARQVLLNSVKLYKMYQPVLDYYTNDIEGITKLKMTVSEITDLLLMKLGDYVQLRKTLVSLSTQPNSKVEETLKQLAASKKPEEQAAANNAYVERYCKSRVSPEPPKGPSPEEKPPVEPPKGPPPGEKPPEAKPPAEPAKGPPPSEKPPASPAI